MAKKKGAKLKGRRPPPVCKAILLCESVSTDPETNHVSVFRIFNSFALPKFPLSLDPIIVFLQLTNGIGRYWTAVEVHDLHDGEVMGRVEVFVDFPDRLTVRNLAITVPLLLLTHAGVYDVIVSAEGQEIDRQQFTVVPAEESENGFEETES
jgi:Family of unknown function (DUF6941)